MSHWYDIFPQTHEYVPEPAKPAMVPPAMQDDMYRRLGMQMALGGMSSGPDLPGMGPHAMDGLTYADAANVIAQALMARRQLDAQDFANAHGVHAHLRGGAGTVYNAGEGTTTYENPRDIHVGESKLQQEQSLKFTHPGEPTLDDEYDKDARAKAIIIDQLRRRGATRMLGYSLTDPGQIPDVANMIVPNI